MSDRKYGDPLTVQDQASEPIVAFYLTQKTDLPATFQGNHQVVTITILNSAGKPLSKPALRVTFSHDQSIDELVGLVGFGRDPRCNVLLPADFVSSVHCRIYAQLNSGPRAWLVDDSSTRGTLVDDDESRHDKISKIVHGRRQAAQGLRSIEIGPYTFQILAPVSNAEVRRREQWFQLNKPIPVTRSMLDRQLGSLRYDLLRMDRVGSGGNGEVYKYMEKNTALCVAIKEEDLQDSEKEVRVKKEVGYMETLHHPYLVDILFSECTMKQTIPTQYTVMPLYLGNLWALLLKDLDIQTKERIIIQVFEGVNYMHNKQILHRDLKPDNIFWVTESPLIVKVGDYGLATSLADYDTLFEICGTTAYMAPEIFKRNIIKTKAVDLYSLGATVFAILEHEIVTQGWYTRGNPPQRYNRIFENVANSPPKLYAGLIQSMMAPNPEDRPSLETCIEAVKGRDYSWTKKSQRAAMPTTAPIVPIHYDTQGQQQTPLDRARASAIKKNLRPIVQARQPNVRPNPQLSPVKLDGKNQQDAVLLQEPEIPFTQAVAVKAPKRSRPPPVQGVNFQDGLPSYEEATSKNPFARLADSHEVTRKRHRSELARRQNADGADAGQRANPLPRKLKKPAPPMDPVKPGVQPHASTTHSRTSASHSTSSSRAHSTSSSRARGHHPRHSRQIIRRPREHAQTLDIRRTGRGRIRKTTLTGIKTGAVEMATGAVDMGKGIYQFARGFGAATCNIGCLTAQGVMMLCDFATREKKPAPNAQLRLAGDEQQLVVSMVARSFRREAERQRATVVYAEKQKMEDGRWRALRGGNGNGNGLPRISEGVEPAWEG